MKRVAIFTLGAIVGAFIFWVVTVNVFNDAGNGCWNEINKSQPLGIEKVCNQ